VRFWILAALFCANAYVWLVPVPQALTVSFLDVGEGDAAFIESPAGARVLIDGGPSSGATLRKVGQRLPFFVRSLDAVIETAPSESYAAGLVGVLSRYETRLFLSSPFSGDTKTADTVSRAAAASGAERSVLSRGMRVMLGGGAYIDVLSPSAAAAKLDANSGALMLRLVYGKTSFFFTSASLSKTELALAARDGEALRSDVLKAGGHGSKSASAAAFAAAVSPEATVFSRGCDNRYGHPAPEVVARFQALGAEVFDTCAGDAVFRSDGVSVTAMPR
jgi:competence protein ComEC